MVQPALRLVQPSPLGVPWPDPNDATDLLVIVEAQTKTMADNAVLIDRYQGILNAAQAAPVPGVATGTGASTGTTSLTVSNVAGGTVDIGDTVAGAGVPTGTTITAQPSGTPGGAGTYTTNVATTLTNVALTFTPPPGVATGTGTATGTSLAVTAVNGAIITGATVAGLGVPAGTTIVNQQSGAAGGSGTYTTSVATTAAAAPLAFTPPKAASSWPTPQDAPTLMLIMQNQSAVTRTQAALISHYQDVLNTSQTPIA
jgi:hypothetical protein